MRLDIQSLHFKAKEELEELIRDKVEGTFSKFEWIMNGQVYLKLENNDANKNKVVELELHMPKENLFAKAQDETFEIALDDVVQKMERQVKKYKEKVYKKR